MLQSMKVSESFSQVEEEWNEFGMVDIDFLPLYGLPNNIDYVNMNNNSSNFVKDTDIPTSAVIFQSQEEKEIKDFNKDKVKEDTTIDNNNNPSIKQSLQYTEIFNRTSSLLRMSAPTLSRPVETVIAESDNSNMFPKIEDPLRIIGVAERKRIEGITVKKSISCDNLSSINSSSITVNSMNKINNDKKEMNKSTSISSLPGLSSINSIALLPGVRWEHQSPSNTMSSTLFSQSVSILNDKNNSSSSYLKSTSLPINITNMLSNIKKNGNHLDHMQQLQERIEPLQSDKLKSNITFIDIMDSKLDGSDVYTKTGLLEPLNSSDKWDDHQFEELYNNINQPGKSSLRNNAATHRSAQIGANNLNIDVEYLKNKISLMTPKDDLFSEYNRFEDNNLKFANNFNCDIHDENVSVLKLAMDQGFYDVAEILKVDTEFNVSGRARNRLLRGATSCQESSLNLKDTIKRDDSNNAMVDQSTNVPSLLEREIAPVGSQSRKKLDLSHYTNMRPSEIPHVIDQGVDCIILRDAKIGENQHNMNNLRQLLSKMFYSTQMNKVKLLDISGNLFGYNGAALICESMLHINGMEQLIEFLARNNRLRDSGTAQLLECILGDNEDHHLKKVDISNNAINFNCGKVLKALGSFKNLIILDLSWNQITLVNTKQITELTDCFKNLPLLEILSLAYNRIQDKGAITILDICKNSMKNLKILDISYCFITSLSIPSLLAYIESSKFVTHDDNGNNSALELLLLFGAIFLPEEKETLHVVANNNHVKIVNSGHYNGIDIIEDYYVPPVLDILPSERLQYRKQQKVPVHNEEDSVISTTSINTAVSTSINNEI